MSLEHMSTEKKRGRLITLEGLEGAGKSSLIPFVAKILEGRGVQLAVTREPGGTTLGEKVRSLLLDPEENIAPLAELCLVFAARAQHIADVIEPALTQGVWVLCDRFTEASFAYQGGGRSLGPEKIATLEALIQSDLRPDLTLLLDLDPATGLERTRGRHFQDRFESEQLSFFERTRAAYLAHQAEHEDRIVIVDAAPSELEVQAAVRHVLEQVLRLWT